MRWKTWAAVIVMTGSVSGAVAQTADTFKASSLSVACSPPAGASQADKDRAANICAAFTRGLAQGMFVMQVARDKGLRTCIPTDSNLDQATVVRIFTNRLRERPDMISGSAGVVAATAIINAYPCSAG